VVWFTYTGCVVCAEQVDAMMGAAKEGGHLQKLLSEYTRPQQRQTILASATIPQHRRFLNDCIQNKWVKVCYSIYQLNVSLIFFVVAIDQMQEH